MTPGLELWTEIRGRVQALQTLDRSSPLYSSLVRAGVDQAALDRFLGGPRGRKSPTPARPRMAAMVERLLELGGHVAGGAALKSWLYMENDGDVDVFFNDYPTWVTATLLAYEDPTIDVCLYASDPCEMFDLGIARCSYSAAGFRIDPECHAALDTGTSSIDLSSIIHPVATLRRVTKYASTYGVKFRRDQVMAICRKYRVSNAAVVKEALDCTR